MKNNILGGLVIFLVVVTCLLMLDDISSDRIEQSTYDAINTEQIDNISDLAIIDTEN